MSKPHKIPTTETTEADLREAISQPDPQLLTDLVQSIPVHDALRHISHLNEPQRGHVVSTIDSHTAAALLDEAPADLAVQLIDELESRKAAEIITLLDSDLQADIIQELDQEDASDILSEMPGNDAEIIRELVTYQPESAGGLMTANSFDLNQNDTVGDVLSRLAASDDDLQKYGTQHPYIVDGNRKLLGVISYRTLLSSKRNTPVARIMVPPLCVQPSATLDELIDLFDQHDFLGIPVVDDQQILRGAVSRQAVKDSELKRSEKDSLSRQGVSEELRSMPTWFRSRRRLAWLSSNIVLNIIAASVISAYEETLAAVIAIAVFLPMVSDMSGCSGNQAVGVSMRELALGLAKPTDVFRVWRKEVVVGVINGTILGALICLVAWIWKGNLMLGFVIGTALALNTVIAVSIGGTIPLILKRFGIDPAVASGPLLTTVTDMAGFFLVLSLASISMPYLIK